MKSRVFRGQVRQESGRESRLKSGWKPGPDPGKIRAGDFRRGNICDRAADAGRRGMKTPPGASRAGRRGQGLCDERKDAL